MKPVLLCADAEISAYMVPGEVAEDLEAYCERFLDWNTKEGFTESDFIAYLNEQFFPESKSNLIEVVCVHRKDIPRKYQGCARYNF